MLIYRCFTQYICMRSCYIPICWIASALCRQVCDCLVCDDGAFNVRESHHHLSTLLSSSWLITHGEELWSTKWFYNCDQLERAVAQMWLRSMMRREKTCYYCAIFIWKMHFSWQLISQIYGSLLISWFGGRFE